MPLLNYIIWNVSPEITTFSLPFSDQAITLRWYGVLFALGFIISQQILYFIYRKENKSEKDVDTITVYMIVATIIGARLGHVVFYEPDMLWNDPLAVFLPFEFTPEFRFTGLQGLASHGGAFGILLAIWLYSRKKKPGQNYWQVLDRIVILVALTGALIRLGNFFNSEIVGLPTHGHYGVAFARHVTDILEGFDEVDQVSYVQVDSAANANGYPPAKMLVDFKSDSLAHPGDFTHIVTSLPRHHLTRELFDTTTDIPTILVRNERGSFSTISYVNIIPRHPAQLYESISCFILFAVLLTIWWRRRAALPPGLLLGIFLVACFGLRFIYEFLKENQVGFENNMALNMGQILSIPLFLAGIIILILSFQKKIPGNSTIE